MTIINNEFTRVNLTAAYRFMSIDGNTMSLIFQNNSFVENIIGPAIEFGISGSNGHVYIIQQNRFLHNIRVPSAPRTIFYFDRIQNSSLIITFSKNLYHNNSELLFLSLEAEPTSSTVMVTLNSESLTDNIGPSVPSECTPRTGLIYKRGCFGIFIFEGCTVVNLSNIVIQPYSSMTLNIIDALLLTDINFLIVLINFYPGPASFIPAQIAVYLLVIGPLLCAGAYLIYYLVIVKYSVWTRIKSARNKNYVEQLKLADEENEVQCHNITVQHISVEEYREPLLSIAKND